MWQKNCPVCRKPLEKKHPAETVHCPCGKYEGNGLRTYLSSVLKFADMIVESKIRMPSPAVRGVTLLGPAQPNPTNPLPF